MNLIPRLSKGRWAEELAQQYLIQRGLTPLTQNYRCKWGEIDLILRDGNILVFVEVRYRQHQQYGGGISSITAQKQQRIASTAQHYLQQQRFVQLPTCRFDAVILSHSATNTAPDILWLKDAFRLT
ncbi:TIGR00252 family protein [Beggiatoa alba B18LD]|uniref:UPF0102 protein BegalDRAFT_0566 n=1 Tax=Beggiatoa alba B18LD TaxID=395493 RepID=I3CCZ1_9GAMM|nr:YraN family protein [Beggiatoa alba]EIJ41484.1 TIGR00252 family protein [Beggiatoa alba B18LD]